MSKTTIKIGFLKETLGTVSCDGDFGELEYAGPKAATVKELVESMQRFGYMDFPQSRFLERLPDRLRSYTWAVKVSDDAKV